MNHYAIYIWSCYLLAFFLLGIQSIVVFLEWQKALKSLKNKKPL
jgi:heme exporter protein CcmD